MTVQVDQLALNEAGIVGIVEFIENIPDDVTSLTTPIAHGRALFTNDRWIAYNPHPIAPDEERKLRSVAAWWKDQQS